MVRMPPDVEFSVLQSSACVLILTSCPVEDSATRVFIQLVAAWTSSVGSPELAATFRHRGPMPARVGGAPLVETLSLTSWGRNTLNDAIFVAVAGMTHRDYRGVYSLRGTQEHISLCRYVQLQYETGKGTAARKIT